MLRPPPPHEGRLGIINETTGNSCQTKSFELRDDFIDRIVARTDRKSPGVKEGEDFGTRAMMV